MILIENAPRFATGTKSFKRFTHFRVYVCLYVYMRIRRNSVWWKSLKRADKYWSQHKEKNSLQEHFHQLAVKIEIVCEYNLRLHTNTQSHGLHEQNTHWNLVPLHIIYLFRLLFVHTILNIMKRWNHVKYSCFLTTYNESSLEAIFTRFPSYCIYCFYLSKNCELSKRHGLAMYTRYTYFVNKCHILATFKWLSDYLLILTKKNLERV